MSLNVGGETTESAVELRRQLARIRRENRRFRTLIMGRALEVWVADAHGQTAEVICDDGQAVQTGDALPLALRLEHVHPDDLPRLGQTIHQARATGEAFEVTVRGKRHEGVWRPLKILGFPIRDAQNQVEEWVGVVSDLTEQEEFASKNLELNHRLQLALQTAVAELTVRKRAEAMLRTQNDVLEAISAGRPLIEILQRIIESVESLFANTIASVHLLDDSRHLNFVVGPRLPESYSAPITRFEIGPEVGSCGAAAATGKTVIVSDIAEHPNWVHYRKLALSHGLQACWSVPILAQDRHGGYCAQPRVLGTFALYYQRVAEPTDEELELVTKAAHLAAVAIERDRSERALRQSEERLASQSAALFHASRISSLGLMAAAISHEINQPLNAIANYSATCTRLLHSETDSAALQKLKDCFAKMNASALLAGDIVRRMRTYVRNDSMRQDPHDFRTIVADALALAHAEMRARQVRIEYHHSGGEAPVVGDAVQLQQVIINLLTNAADAMSECEPHRRVVKVDSVSLEKVVECVVCDSGPGFSQEIRSRLFEPFLTTKSHGSGIGLNICRNILHDHGGTLAIDNNPRGGAIVQFQLPLGVVSTDGQVA